MKELDDKLFARPVQSWLDVGELGMIAIFWTDKTVGSGDPCETISQFVLGRDPQLDNEYRDERSRALLIQAAAKMAMGGATYAR